VNSQLNFVISFLFLGIHFQNIAEFHRYQI
jgi:hypothetical protein